MKQERRSMERLYWDEYWSFVWRAAIALRYARTVRLFHPETCHDTSLRIQYAAQLYAILCRRYSARLHRSMHLQVSRDWR